MKWKQRQKASEMAYTNRCSANRKRVTETERQLKEKEAKRLALEKAKRLQAEKDIKEKEAKRSAL